MDTLLFSSDLHGQPSILSALLDKASTFHAKMLLLTGDTCPSGGSSFAEIFKTSPVPIVSVRGNCDNQYDFNSAGLTFPPSLRRIPFCGRTIVMMHGDQYFTPRILALKDHDLVLSGHTHRPSLTIQKGDIVYANPGSPTYPRSEQGATYGIIENGRIEIRSFETDLPIPGLQHYLTPLICI
jgi:putative phosphoesterase